MSSTRKFMQFAYSHKIKCILFSVKVPAKTNNKR